MDGTVSNEKMEYNEENIKRILQRYTSIENVHVFLSSYLKKHLKHEVTKKIINSIRKCRTDALYLVINLDYEKLVDLAYLVYFDPCKNGEPEIMFIPFIGYEIVKIVYVFTLYEFSSSMFVSMPLLRIALDVTDEEKPLPYILEYVKCRIEVNLYHWNSLNFINGIKAINAKNTEELEMEHSKVIKEIVGNSSLEKALECKLSI